VIDHSQDIAASPAVTTIWSALRLVSVAEKRNFAVATGAGFDINNGFIYEHISTLYDKYVNSAICCGLGFVIELRLDIGGFFHLWRRGGLILVT
jgi:hypothetical protein